MIVACTCHMVMSGLITFVNWSYTIFCLFCRHVTVVNNFIIFAMIFEFLNVKIDISLKNNKVRDAYWFAISNVDCMTSWGYQYFLFKIIHLYFPMKCSFLSSNVHMRWLCWCHRGKWEVFKSSLFLWDLSRIIVVTMENIYLKEKGNQNVNHTRKLPLMCVSFFWKSHPSNPI